jgi:hypothetical protein
MLGAARRTSGLMLRVPVPRRLIVDGPRCGRSVLAVCVAWFTVGAASLPILHGGSRSSTGNRASVP